MSSKTYKLTEDDYFNIINAIIKIKQKHGVSLLCLLNDQSIYKRLLYTINTPGAEFQFEVYCSPNTSLTVRIVGRGQ